MPKDDAAPLSAEEMLADPGEGAAPVDLEAALDAAETEDMEGIDPNHPVLSVAEQREAILAARKRVTSDTKKEALKQLEARAYEELRGKKGQRTGDPIKDEMVYVTLDLAEHSDRIVLNGTTYWHGQTYKVPRHVADTMREIQARGHDHQNELDGKGIAERSKRPRMTTISERTGVVANAPMAAA